MFVLSLVACVKEPIVEETTKVRLVTLSAQSPITVNNSNQSYRKSRVNLTTTSASYYFPGDLMKFTIELEDPNYEFISLLSIKFNGQVIRANTDDAYFKTRDCQSNICIDFDVILDVETNEYIVNEVNFAKLNKESGISAIIDDQSLNSITIPVYKSNLSPYIASSLETINELIKKMTFFTEEYINDQITPQDVSSFIKDIEKNTVTILNIDESPSITEANISAGWWMISVGEVIQKTGDPNNWAFESSISVSLEPTQAQMLIGGNSTLIDIPYPYLTIILFNEKYSNSYAFNIGNDIYLKIDGVDYFILTLGMRTQIVDFTYTKINS